MQLLRFITSSAMFICSAIAFFYGLFRHFGKNTPLYVKAVVTGLGCLAGGRFAVIVLMFSGASIGNRFNIGHIGFVGFFLFLFTALHGELDSFFKKEVLSEGGHRYRGFLAPIVLLVFILNIIFADNCTVYYKGICICLSVYILITSYYSLCHLVDLTDKCGVIYSLRWFNIFCLGICLTSMAEMYLLTTESVTLLISTYFLMGVFTLLLVPSLEKSIPKAKKGADKP